MAIWMIRCSRTCTRKSKEARARRVSTVIPKMTDEGSAPVIRSMSPGPKQNPVWIDWVPILITVSTIQCLRMNLLHHRVLGSGLKLDALALSLSLLLWAWMWRDWPPVWDYNPSRREDHL